MIKLIDYNILNQIYASDNSLVYRAIRKIDQVPVIIKFLQEDYPSANALIRYQQEYEILKNIDIEGVIKVYALQKHQNSLFLCLEDFGGYSLRILQSQQVFTLDEFLFLAIKISDILGEIHQSNIIHKDINPSNIIYNRALKQVKIIDFGISTKLSRSHPTINNLRLLEGTLAYISPEQTGRMNRSLDYRSDFYSLGVTFYELLTNQLPFITEEPLELIHSHLAKIPLSPHEINPEIPQAMSDIVMKLLAKTAEERYQSAWGIKADLIECLNQLNTTGIISSFPLATQDIVPRFQISQKLYGRKEEITELLTTFERITQGNYIEMMLVSGYSGLGKSSLVHELYQPITAAKGYFISGKFDQLQKNIPYSAVIQAFNELIKQLLTESANKLEIWREKILNTLGNNAQIIIDVIPDIELIIGKQSPVPELPALESQNRFNIVLTNFINIFCQKAHPLVIFLDDLQWADSGTLKLIQLILTDTNIKYLFVICAYRNNEVSPSHPWMITLDELQQKHTIINEIILKKLTVTHISQLIADTLSTDVNTVTPLAELVAQKTAGNPFFVNEFIKTLYTENLIKFNAHYSLVDKNFWQWDLTEIKGKNITDNVVELMIGKLNKLPESSREILRLAACIGSNFDLYTLAIICEKSIKEIYEQLKIVLESGLILAKSELNTDLLIEYYQFLHDRVQQAAYLLIDQSQKQLIHLQIGRLLLSNTKPEYLTEKIFTLVDHINMGVELIDSQNERDQMAKYNLIAGKKALLATAYIASKNYLTFARGLLGDNCWNENYNLTLEIYQISAEVAYLCTEFERLNRFTEMVLKQGKILLDKVKIYQVKIQAFIAQHQLLEAINTALEILQLLGINFPENPTTEDIQKAFHETELMLIEKNIPDLIDLPQMNDPEKIAAIFILALIISASYSAFPQLLPLIVIKQVQLSIQYGNATVSPVAYGSYGFILCGVIGDIDTGYEWGKLALNLLHKLNVNEFKAKTFNMVHLLINHWKSHTKKSLSYLKEAYQSGLETGDLEFALITIHGYCYNSCLIGKELNQVDKEIVLYTESIKQFKNNMVLTWQNLWHQTVLNLLGKSDDLCQLIGSSFNAKTMLSVLQEAKNGAGLYVLYCNQLMLSYVFYEYEQALQNALEAEKYLINVTSLSTVPLFYFYDCLTQLAIYDQVDKSHQKLILQRVKSHQIKMKKWGDYAPMNYLHKYYLVEAEKYRVRGKNGLAREMYDRAIALAQQHEYLHEEALANELATKFYLSIGKNKIAHVYFNDAYYCYTRWGAKAKITHLENTYPQFLSQLNTTDNTIKTRTTISNNSEKTLDISTVFKASQAISGEIILDKLLDYLMKILIQSAGAQKGFIIIKSASKNDKLLIEVTGLADSEKVTILPSIDIENSTEIAISIVQYTARTNKIVLLNDAMNEGQFIQDKYIQKNKVKSILCAPLINQGQLTGIVYLENNLTTGAFTNQRLEIVQLLSTQAAIAISNAQLYSQVRESENRLNQLLETIPVGVFVIDANYQPYYLNSWGEKLLKKGIVKNVDPLKLREIYQVYLAGTQEIYPVEKDPVFRAFKGESVNVDDVEIHREDAIIPLEVWANPIYNVEGNIAYVILAFIDITERKKAEDERQDFISQLFDVNINLELALEGESLLTNAAKRFVPSEFLALLNKESIVEIELGDHVELEMSVLFSDIRDFTSLSEKMNPAENFKFINSYLSRMETAISQNNGFIDKYIGDAIMALFNGSADEAVTAGIEMLNQIILYNQQRANFDYPPIGIGIGINTGLLMLGTVGGQNRIDTTVISDAVNLASRVENLTKNYGVSLLITHQTFSKLKNPDKYYIRQIDTVQVKGKSEWITIYEVFDADLPEIRAAKLLTKIDFETALLMYNQKKYPEALRGFEYCLSVNENDQVAQIYLQKCHFSNQ